MVRDECVRGLAGVDNFHPRVGSGSPARGCRLSKSVRSKVAGNKGGAVGAFGWGLLASSSLLIGAAVALVRPPGQRTVALVMAFGAGVLIRAVAYDLVPGFVREEQRQNTGRRARGGGA